MRKSYLVLILLAFIAGCSDPKSLVIPREAAGMNEFSKKVKNLNAEEKYLLNYYLDDYDDYKVPVGITVEEAINEQRKILKRRDSYNPPK